MRYVSCWLSVAGLLVLGTFSSQGQDKKQAAAVYESDFYPLRVGNHWRYKVTAHGDAPGKDVPGKDSPVVEITVDKQEPYDNKSTQDKKEVVEPILRSQLKVVSGAKVLTENVAVLKDGVYRFSTGGTDLAPAGKEITPPLRFLKLPVMSGETWTVNSASEGVGLTGTFSCADEAVKVPAGQFQTKHIASKDFQLGTQKMSIDYWFAKNIGMVKQRVRVGNSDILLELEEFKAGK
jgi:hypothetical protein